MKTRILALTLAVLLLLPGCSAMLNRDYQVVYPHPELPSTEEDSSVIRVETYQQLVNAVLYFVEQSVEHGVVRLVNYAQDVEADLNRACLEVAKDDPLGAYAVDFIKHDYTRVVATYEANIYITYRRTAEQMRALVNVTGSSAIREELREALETFSPEVALRVAYFAEDEDYICSLVRQAYYDTPAAAMGMPEFTVSLYPDEGSQRIVEIVLTYPEEQTALLQKQSDTLAAAQQLTGPYVGLSDPQERLTALLSTLPASLSPVAGPGPSTAWDALVGGAADDEGLALALHLLCDLIDVDCMVTEGTLHGEPHFWNTLTAGTYEYRHIDLSGENPSQICSDAEMAEQGYIWPGGETADAPGTAGEPTADIYADSESPNYLLD